MFVLLKLISDRETVLKISEVYFKNDNLKNCQDIFFSPSFYIKQCNIFGGIFKKCIYKILEYILYIKRKYGYSIRLLWDIGNVKQ